MENTYKPESFEKEIYAFWKQNKFFSAKVNNQKKKFSMVMPPPNVTGQLHLGHALNNTIQDIIIRHKRMQGFEALWIPGTDHAAIATEARVVQKIKEEGKTKENIGREEFISLGWDWYRKYGNRICEQLEELGVSPDWDRLAFTMDDNLSKAVTHAFVHYYNKGYIYRGKRVTNWCPGCHSAISDMENEYIIQNTSIWHIKYPFEDKSGYITVATTRPETMFGDTAVAVNPNDERYKNLIGKNLILPFVNKVIPLIADDYCEIGFGSGAVKITPAHDPNDYEVGLRHNLEVVNCIDDTGHLMENTGEFAGLTREEGRVRVVKRLEELGLIAKIEKYKHSVGTCQRCKTITEPRITTQWWVKMEELARPAVEALKNGDVKFVPKRFEKQYLNWLVNIKDWCISRQLWLGHRIPAYYIDEEIVIVTENPKEDVYEKYAGHAIKQDEDVLDTWFSSALWPFSTLGYPDKTADLEYFYPTDTLVTAYDIISFWVSKMVYSGLEFVGKVPFYDVVINGIVRDKIGRKMSKSLGNGIDPIEIIEKYGADSLRYSLIIGMGMGIDTRFDEEKPKQAKIFMNKLFNASKFVMMNTADLKYENLSEIILSDKDKLTYAQKWILSELNKLTKEVNRNLDKYEQGIALLKLTNFFWGKFCDWYIEISKNELATQNADTAKVVLLYVFSQTLKLMHPFIPFITEHLYQNLSVHSKTIMLEEYPSYNEKLHFKDGKTFFGVMEVVKNIRNVRAEMKVPDNKKTNMFLQIFSSAKLYKENMTNIQKLAFGKEIATFEDFDNSDKYVKIICESVTVYIEKSQLTDSTEQQKRYMEELSKLETEIARSEKMLANVGFISKAPAKVIAEEKEKLQKNKLLYEKLKSGLINA